MQYSVRKLTASDSLGFVDYCHKQCARKDDVKHLLGENPAHFNAAARLLLNDNNTPIFGLFQNKAMIGKAVINFYGDTAEYTGLYILADNRGKGLSNLLHAARRDHLNDIDFQGRIITKILPSNTQSFNTAIRNGFKITHKKIEKKALYDVYELRL